LCVAFPFRPMTNVFASLIFKPKLPQYLSLQTLVFLSEVNKYSKSFTLKITEAKTYKLCDGF